jgi:XRE family aerobic/anaerobic benzoate catabolism transcriptional regulator
MASGKSTVGRLLAARLGWSFVDFDREVEKRAGRSVARIFLEQGEEAFRALEGQVGGELLRRERVVLAAGGGWAARPGRLESVPAHTLTVWLQVDAATALARSTATPATRPLLEPGARGARARAESLLAAREPFYARCQLHVDTVGASPDTVVEAIVRAMDEPNRASAP